MGIIEDLDKPHYTNSLRLSAKPFYASQQCFTCFTTRGECGLIEEFLLQLQRLLFPGPVALVDAECRFI